MRMEDIARKAGVSQATVSRVLSGGSGVSPAKTEAVLKWAKELKFSRKKRAGRVCGIPNIGIYFTGRYFERSTSLLFSKIEVVADEIFQRYNVVFLPVALPPEQLEHEILRRRIVALLLVGHDSSAKLEAILRTIPHAWLNSHENRAFSNVLHGNREAGRLAASYLTDRGCRNLGALRVPSHNPGYVARLEGFMEESSRREMKALVFPCGEPQRFFEDISIPELEASIEKTFEFMSEVILRCDGLFCPDDRVTAVLFRILLRRGLVLTHKLRVISCNNDLNCLAGLYPRPATIDFAPELTTRLAIQQLFAQLSGREDADPDAVFIRPELIPGDEF